MIHWESPHELNAYRLLDSNPEVLSFHEQPLTIRYLLGGQEHIHYPDVLVNFPSRKELWEIKTASDVTTPEVLTRTQFMQSRLPDKGFLYRIVTGEELARNPRLSNVLILLKFGRQQVSFADRERLIQLLGVSSEISWKAASQFLLPNGPRILSRLFLEGLICCDLDIPITGLTNFVLRNKQKVG